MLDFENLSEYREDNRLEAKFAKGGVPLSIWETYSAFANSNGGVILLGVKEKKDKSLEISGIENPEKLLKDFWDTINNRTKISRNLLREEIQVLDAMKETFGTKPSYREKFTPDRTEMTFYLDKNEGTTQKNYPENEETTQKNYREKSETTEKMLAFMKENPSITTSELAEKVGISIDGINYNIRKLKEKNLLMREGGDRGGHWVVLKN